MRLVLIAARFLILGEKRWFWVRGWKIGQRACVRGQYSLLLCLHGIKYCLLIETNFS